jgi:hypothetical protein
MRVTFYSATRDVRDLNVKSVCRCGRASADPGRIAARSRARVDLPARDHYETQSTRWHTSPPLPPSRCARRRAYAKIERSKHQPRAAIGSGFAWRAAREQRRSSASRLAGRPIAMAKPPLSLKCDSR